MAKISRKPIGLLLLPFLFSASLNAATYTDPLGVVKLTIAGAPAAGQSKLTAISATLRGAIEYQGVATSIGVFDADAAGSPPNPSQVLNTGVTTWTATQWTAQPHLCYIENAAGAEEAYLITAMDNATGVLTLASTFDFSTRYPSTPTFRIYKALTLSSILSNLTIDGVAGTFHSSDRIYIWNGASWDSYLYVDFWRKTTALTVNANDTVIFPDEGLLISRSQTSDVTIRLHGSVPTNAQISTISGAAFISNRYPIGTTLNGTGIQDENWTSADRLYIWNGTSWDSYLYVDFWRKTTALVEDANSTVIPADSAMFISRATPLAEESADVTHPMPYTP